jgi:hypothetical protein
MNNRFLGILLLGGAGYLFYKYYYLPFYGKKIEEPTNNIEEQIDGATKFYGDSKDDYIRGYVLPSKITDIKIDEIFVLTKPKQSVFSYEPKSMFKVTLDKDANRVIFTNYSNQDKYIAEYEKIKDNLVMAKDYTA